MFKTGIWNSSVLIMCETFNTFEPFLEISLPKNKLSQKTNDNNIKTCKTVILLNR